MSKAFDYIAFGIPFAFSVGACSASSEGESVVHQDRGGDMTVDDAVVEQPPGQQSSGGGTSIDLGGSTDTGGTTPTDDSCAGTSAEATLVTQPVDIILVLDNSGSMADELEAVEQNINVNFAQILTGSNVDYRVILISRHRVEDRTASEEASTSICVSSPLSGLASCPAEDGPVLTERFFQFSTKVESTDSFDILLDTFEPPIDDEDKYDNGVDGWSAWLRPDAKPVFLEMTDDNAEMPVTTFLEGLTALTVGGAAHFGTGPDAPAFVWHSIIGIAEKSTPTDAYLSGEPLQTGICTGNSNTVENAGESYQDLSMRTGGLRFPLCQFDGFDTVFRTIAEDVIVTSSIACDFAIPSAPEGEGDLDLENVAVNYTKGDGSGEVKFGQALTQADCQADAFYIDSDRIVLCPEACTAVQNDPFSSVDVLFTCESQIIIK